MTTHISRRSTSIEDERIAGAKACLEALKAVEHDANHVIPTLGDHDCRAFLEHQAESAATLAAKFGPLTARQEGAFMALVEYIHYSHTTGEPNLEQWVPVVGMTPEELEARIEEVRQMLEADIKQGAMDGPGGSMVTGGSSQEQGAPVPQPDIPPERKVPTPAEFREAVEMMDSMSQWAFNKIEALASLALLAMESPGTYRDPDTLAETLHTITYLANDARGLINSQAEGMGENYKDEPGLVSSRRRWDAMRAAQQQSTEGRA